MKSRLIYSTLILTAIAFLSFNFNGKYFTVSQDKKVTISGTSTLHDWVSEVQKIEGNADILITQNQIKEINKLSLKLKVTSIKSGKEKMDKNTYKALNASNYPHILFNLTKVSSINDNTIEVSGELEVAGTTKPVRLVANSSIENGIVTVKGKYDLKMTDFNVEPPVLMLGALKTGDQVTINYQVSFKAE
ncbi:MAG: YceI family protein [Cyclobacteriaceae bacterium]